MDKALKFTVEKAELPLYKVSQLVSLTPAKLMKLDKTKGSIAPEKDGDIVLTDKDLYVKQVYVQGKRVI